MAFTKFERARIRHHLGYINVAEREVYQLGQTAALETQFQIEGAMDLVILEAEVIAREHIGYLDRIEAQMVDDLELLAVESIDEIKLRKDEQQQLRNNYLYWRAALCNVLGSYPNPFDKRYGSDGAVGGINASVKH